MTFIILVLLLLSSTYPSYIGYFWLPATLSHSLAALVTVQSLSIKKIMITFQRASFQVGKFSSYFFLKTWDFHNPQFSRQEIFFFFLMWDFYNPQLSRWENLGFSICWQTFIFLVKLYNETFARAFYRDFFIIFNQIAFFKKYFIALSRVYFTLGGIGGPEKDQSLRVS